MIILETDEMEIIKDFNILGVEDLNFEDGNPENLRLDGDTPLVIRIIENIIIFIFNLFKNKKAY